MRGRPGYEQRVLWLALFAGLPAVVAALVPLWLARPPARVTATVALLVLGSWLGLSVSVRQHATRPLQTLANLLAALREGDFTVRGRPGGGDRDDALGAAMAEVNALAETLRQQRLGALEAHALLGKVMDEIAVAVFAFDEQGRLALVNPAGARLLPGQPERLLGRDAAELGLAALLEGEAAGRVDGVLRGAPGPWELRRTPFRQGGRPHTLVVLHDLHRALRDEERLAWQRLVRVLGHEINNSLAPIQSIADNLVTLLQRTPRPAELDDDLARGLAVIDRRAAALGRFLSAYAHLARLPPPVPVTVPVSTWVARVAALETRLAVAVGPGPAVAVHGDPDQLDQLLINLVRNAVDAALETGGGVQVRWRAWRRRIEVLVLDDGPGPPLSGNLFVPFFTTKPEGSGIGLALSRQIAEAHGGSLTLQARGDGRPGCAARLLLRRSEDAAGAPETQPGGDGDDDA